MRRILALVLPVVLLATVPLSEGAKQPKQLVSDKHSAMFKCTVCSTFCDEYEKAIEELPRDTHYKDAVQNAHDKVIDYRWDDHRGVLRPAGQSMGAVATAAIDKELSEEMRTDHVDYAILHALHAAGHLKRPSRLPWSFCRRHLCEQYLKVCDKRPDSVDRPMVELTHAYENLVHQFDAELGKRKKFVDKRTGHTRHTRAAHLPRGHTADRSYVHPHEVHEEHRKRRADEPAHLASEELVASQASQRELEELTRMFGGNEEAARTYAEEKRRMAERTFQDVDVGDIEMPTMAQASTDDMFV